MQRQLARCTPRRLNGRWAARSSIVCVAPSLARHSTRTIQISHSAAAAVAQTQRRWAHTRPSTFSPVSSSSSPPAPPARTTSSYEAPSSSAGTAATTTTTLGILQRFVQQRDYDGCAAYYEHHFDPPRQHFIDDFCGGFAADARDALLTLMRVYTNMGRIDKVRGVLSVGLRDLAAAEVQHATPLRYASLSQQDEAAMWEKAGEVATSRSVSAAPPLRDDLLLPTTAPSSAEKAGAASGTAEPALSWHRASLLNASLFNAYLEALTRRSKFAVNEVTFLLEQMKTAGVRRDALTYHYLIELHVRAGYDPIGLWEEMKAQEEPPVLPLPATVQTLLLRVVPSSPDPAFVVDVTKAALRFGTTVMDKRMLADMIEQWLSGTARTTAPASSSSSVDPQRSSSSSSSSNRASRYPPEYTLWLMLELELRCVLEKASFTQYVQRQHLTELLLQCAKCTDAATAEQVLALMDRHALPKTADVLALVIWCWSQALEVEKTLDLIEWMALKGYLDQVDCFRKAYIDTLRYAMEQHYLMTFAEALSTPALAERALTHLHARRQRGELVSAHSLDLIVLSFARLGEERRALQLVATYETRWGVSPRTSTFNALLVGCSRHRSTMLHRVVYRTMVNSGVAANVFTFRVLIRQAVVTGNIDEAIFYLEEVTRHPGLRVEVEMILPILERAARVGDGETVNRMSQYSLKCDIGIDKGVLRSVMQQLTEAGQSVEVLKGQLPLHEALRSRSKTGRQRARNEVLL
ncbi:putative mitochondrial hypothetical protein [Leptomonas pyrrhocoris]|uniref:Uncharacterized protein n=1 Tax=Leptomonas pyrrhocoris TaxID=157538 RepID=A0A0M9FXT5_LEPPY|nr:putative mitochondrial hypothetical protein [Leptomonas pyrrhocoris]KPA78137.1 putative mitochondrial hypothetical protein [Leptomonas pyrrhocoris]|eukprot:XP_015656576.1 putative mitochondrial hypothetical protein [Leptomonas pyrrhocoris]